MLFSETHKIKNKIFRYSMKNKNRIKKQKFINRI